MIAFKTRQINYNGQSHDCVFIFNASCNYYGPCSIYVDVLNRKALCVQKESNEVISIMDITPSLIGILLFSPQNNIESTKFLEESRYLCIRFGIDISDRLDERIILEYMSNIE